MDQLLQVKDIVQKIACHLNTRDLLSFQQLNRQLYFEHLNKEFEAAYYSQKLILMGLSQVVDSSPLDDTVDLNLLNAFIHFEKFSVVHCKKVYQMLYRIYHRYCDKLYYNNLNNFFPPEYDANPLSQSKILLNVFRFNKSNVMDQTYYQRINDNFNILKEVFSNSCLTEMETNFEKGQYNEVGKFSHILLLFDDTNVAIDFFNSKIEYPKLIIPENSKLDETEIVNLLVPLQQFLNEKIELIDTLFSDQYPIFFQFYETFIQQTILEGLETIVEYGKGKNSNDNDEFYLEIFPTFYFNAARLLCDDLNHSQNGSMNLSQEETFQKSARELFDLYLEPKVSNYLNLSTTQFGKSLKKQFKNFVVEQENKTQTDLLNLTTLSQPTSAGNNTIQSETIIIDDLNATTNGLSSSDNNKLNFLDSFTKVFSFSNKQTNHNNDALNNNLTNLINKNLQNIKNLVSLELCYNIVQQLHDRIDIFLKFKCNGKLNNFINEKCEEVFKIMIEEVNEDHVTPAFEKAIDLLNKYNPIENTDLADENAKGSVEPLKNFAGLINIGDIILQMIIIFNKNEMINRNIIDGSDSNKKNIWQNQLLQRRKNFETKIDSFVAEGLNIGINKLLMQIELTFNTVQLPTDYFPSPNEIMRDIQPTKCAKQTVRILHNHCFLLNGATDKGTVEVYQQEIGRRFFFSLVEHIKKQIISTLGAVQLICDVNFYYEFISVKLRQKSIVPYFKSLKNVCSLYLIDGRDSKELGKLISDLNKFEGIFTQEEVYEFVQRRQDWVAVKRDVEKVMYGLGIRDCALM